ncbi:MAG: cytochrome c maturation protein CcmE [Acidimicrobiia bacterium]|nr:cytochrome c maturation protein CcmE [Acidimicrobiia bacterium]MBT8247191.1 cytochrome c maturation protein CcmE [Acidimicrobiia bacterium]NNF87237.1 cytochrome c maturation protein CcmE [Acidimicrobiia bacterium]NNJ47142.1 cytochrome c maturation protein CcmE [Acidimicrobiia bacterium]NNL12509.1 cytochrome c maturation protein CcmE [Acidimicrobiia bacterium]
MKYRAFLIPAIGLLVVLGGFILTFTLNDSFVYYMTPTEALDAKVEFEEGRRFRLSGVVVAGSVEELDAGVRFLAQEPDGSTTVTVVHTRAAPELFQDDIEVVVEGAWEGDEFHSDFMLIKHDEEYRVPEEGNYEDS